MAFCKYCGSEIAAESAFCPECGKKAPTGGHGTSPLTAQESSSHEPLSRKEFCDLSFSHDVKKRVRNNWIALAAGVFLRVAAIPVNAFLMMPGSVRGQYMGYAFSGLIFSATGLCVLLMILACVLKHKGFTIAAVVLGAYKAATIYTIPLGVGNGALLVSAVTILINTLKLEKEYRAYLGRAFPDHIKK